MADRDVSEVSAFRRAASARAGQPAEPSDARRPGKRARAVKRIVIDISAGADASADGPGRVTPARSLIVYGPTREPRSVKRFYNRDPFDRLVNILAPVA